MLSVSLLNTCAAWGFEVPVTGFDPEPEPAETAEPLLPAEKRLIRASLGLGLVLLAGLAALDLWLPH
jgi:hypothetical protein